VNGSYELDATTWSPAAALAADGKQPRRGPSFLFATAVIGGVTLLTAGGVAAFFVAPSQGAPDEKSLVDAQPAVAASSASLQIPVRKVVTRTIAVRKDGDASVADLSARGPSAKDTPAAAAVEGSASAVKSSGEVFAEAGAIDALEQQDPRWARTGTGAEAFASVLQPAASGDALAPGTTSLAGSSPTGSGGSADVTRTAAIAPEAAKPRLAVQSKSGGTAGDAASDDDSSLPPGVSAQTRTIKLGKGVNMRSRPKSGSGVITVVPANATVQLVGCKDWCEIVYKGRRGYIYKSFVGSRAAASSAPATKAKTVFVVDSAKSDDTTADKAKTATVRPISSRAP
jgi:hypothetical protein